jgi:long-chain acyl-CoA synthetase
MRFAKACYFSFEVLGLKPALSLIFCFFFSHFLFYYFEIMKKGKVLSKNPMRPSLVICILDWLCARFVAATMFPLHFLAKKLLYSKIHSAIGITKVRS